MSLLTTPWCFGNFKKASRAAAIYCLVLHSLDILLLIYSTVTIHFVRQNIGQGVQRHFIAPGLDALGYICLGASLIIIILTAILFSWIKQGYPRTPHMMLWVYVVGGVRIFEACVGIYVLGYIGIDSLQMLANTSPGCIFGALYWCGSTAGMVIFGLFVFNYVRELKSTAYGGQRRHKPYMIHTNDIYSPTTRAILSVQDDDMAPVSDNKPQQKRNRQYYSKDEKRPSQTIEFESIV